MAVTPALLAIDAGNTKTDAAVIALDGTVLATARGGGFGPSKSGVEAAVDALAATVRQVVASSGSAAPGPGAPGSGSTLDHVSACLANADLPREERELTAAVRARGWARTAHIANDTFAVLRAGLPDDGSVRHGVAVVCGAGINCVGRAPDGRIHRFPAIGRLSGDWGGGGGLAGEALWHAARAVDGRGTATELARALPAHFGLDTMDELIEALHLGEIPAARQHELVPVLFTAAATGDPVACSLVDRQADEIVALVTVTLTRLGLLADRTPVLLGGGVAAARHPRLHNRIVDQLADRAPKAAISVVTAPPVLGAALLGLDTAGARPPSPAAHARLRAHYARDRTPDR
ncbi:N-acetylglucosamine kinase [Streptomyces gobiensis]|uniref:N-acetylglucosamine kinase n=1 Tax=Streptomyces gobiensis TaxID=2875706 RepID=UPI001E38406A|nr:BadF/BadG/BcrA/BcrD ATPase family protein [Streptomyces gobiensis]UGY91436.1 ATPase [Streptomyces gobiensis]